MPSSRASRDTRRSFSTVRRDRADRNREGVVADVAVMPDDNIEGNDVTFAEDCDWNDGMPWTTSSLTEMQV